MSLSHQINQALGEKRNPHNVHRNKKHFKGVVWKSKQFQDDNNDEFSRKRNPKFYGESLLESLLSETPIQTLYSPPPKTKKKEDPTPDGDYEDSTEHFKVPKETKDTFGESDKLHIDMDAEEKAVADLIQAEEGVQLGQPQDGDFYGGHGKNNLTKDKNPDHKRKNDDFYKKESLVSQINRSLKESPLDMAPPGVAPYNEDPIVDELYDGPATVQTESGSYDFGSVEEASAFMAQCEMDGTVAELITHDGPQGSVVPLA